MDIIIREYQNTDYSGLIVLLHDVYNSDIKQDVLEEKYLSSSRFILVAVNALKQIVGCAFVELQEDYVRPCKIAYVTYVAVDSKVRKQGIGKKLLMSVEQKCRDNGCSAIELTSADFRIGAHAFYSSIGFTHKKTTVFIKEINY